MKRYLKKLSALLLTVVMALALCINVYAAETTNCSITLNGVEDSETVKMLQVIKRDATTPTGWTFNSDTNAESAYTTAFGLTGDDAAQKAILMLMKTVDNNATVSGITVDSAATAAQIEKALSALEFTNADTVTSPVSVVSCGLYAFNVEGRSNFTYKRTTAFVSEGQTSAVSVTVKKSSHTIDKTAKTDSGEGTDDKVTEIGDTVSYTITSTFPYFDLNDNLDHSYVITDILDGAEYDEDSITISMNGTSIVTSGHTLSDYYKIADETKDGQNTGKKVLTIDLSSFIGSDNLHGGQQVSVTYDATVTSTSVTNTASHEVNEDEWGQPKEEKVFTGAILFTKYNEDKTSKLEGAGFKFYKKDGNNNKYAVFTENGTDVSSGMRVWRFTGEWKDNLDDGTEVFTGTDGQLKVEGLNVGDYYFKETTAPTDYSINNNDSSEKISLSADEPYASDIVLNQNGSMTDTKTTALPSTGGYGIYIFTIVGVVVMAVMASMFFIKRRRDAMND